MTLDRNNSKIQFYKYNKTNILRLISDILFFYSLFLFLINNITSWFLVERFKFVDKLFFYSETYVNKYIIYVLIICIALKSNEIIKCFLLLLLYFLISYKAFTLSGNITVYATILMVIASIDLNGYKIIRFNTIVKLIMWCFTVLLSLFGVIQNYIDPADKRHRAFLGYSWTTIPAITFLFITFSIIMLKKGKLKIIEYIILYLVNIWLYIQTNTRFCFIIVVATLTFFMLIGNSLDVLFEKKVIKTICILMPWVSAALTFILMFLYGMGISGMEKLNSLLSGRLRLGYLAYNTYGVTLFGQKISWVGFNAFQPNTGSYNYVDSAYLQTFFSYGLISLMVYLSIFSIIIYRALKIKNYTLVWLMMFLCIFAITEPQLCWLHYNNFMLLCFADLNIKKISVKRTMYKDKIRGGSYAVN